MTGRWWSRCAEAREIVGQPIVDAITGKDAAASADTANEAFQKFLDDEASKPRAGGRAPAPATRPARRPGVPMRSHHRDPGAATTSGDPRHAGLGRAGPTTTASGSSPRRP